MADTVPLLRNVLQSATPSLASLALDEFKLCWSFVDDLEHLRQCNIFIEDHLNYIEKRYMEQQLRFSESNPSGEIQCDSEHSVTEVMCIMKSANYDIEDIMNDSLYLKEYLKDTNFFQKVRSFFSLSNQIILRFDLIERIKAVEKELRRLQHFISCTEKLPTSERTITSSVNVCATIIGRDQDLTIIKDTMMKPNSNNITILSIFGPVGFGKTSIAGLVYYASWIEQEFYIRIWINLSIGSIDIEGIAQCIISKARSSVERNMDLKVELQQILVDKKCLIVLDGLFGSDEKLMELKHMLMTGQPTRSKIIVTTHSDKVANMIGTVKAYRVPALSDYNCSIIFQSVLTCQNIILFERYGNAIIRRCEGIPLVAKFLGSVVNTGPTWDKTWEAAQNRSMWKLERAICNAIRPMPMFQPFKQIYYNMSARLRKCFIYCSIFPEGSDLDKEKISRQWITLGLIDSTDNTLPGELVADVFMQEIKSIFFFEAADEHAEVVADGQGARSEVLRMHTLAYNLARCVGNRDVLVFSEDEKINTTDKYSDYRYAQLDVSLLKSIDKKSWPLKARALILKANEIDLELVSQVISESRYLRVLDLRGCNMSTLPPCVFELKHLRYLDASGLDILQIAIPRNSFEKLETLDLSETKLQELPFRLSKLKMLSYLSLRGCSEILYLPHNFGMFTKLQYLDLSLCIGLQELPASFENLRHIDFLDLSGCQESITNYVLPLPDL